MTNNYCNQNVLSYGVALRAQTLVSCGTGTFKFATSRNLRTSCGWRWQSTTGIQGPSIYVAFEHLLLTT